MPLYTVYRARFTSKLGTPRSYVGQTYALDLRKAFHGSSGWLKCCANQECSEFNEAVTLGNVSALLPTDTDPERN